MKISISKLLFAFITFAFTLFVFANTYEVVFNKDIALAHSVRKVEIQAPINGAIKDFSSRALTDEINASTGLNSMERIEIPALNSRVRVEESRKIDGSWYERPGALHYIELNRNQHGAPIDYLLYGTQSWQTITEANQIEKGMEVDVYFGGGAATFTVTDKKIAAVQQSLLVGKSEARQILLLIENPQEALYYGYSLELKK
jgi:hypothetical protein